MPNVLDVVEQLKRRMLRDAKFLEESREELDALRSVVEKAGDLSEKMDEAEFRIRLTIEMLGNKQSKEVLSQSKIGPDLLERSKYRSPEKVSLWAYMKEYLQLVKEARVGDIVMFLQAIGIGYAKRQTIESVIRRKSRTFRVTKRGGQKFVSLCPNWYSDLSDHPRDWMAKK
jgi:hypothetical protein